MNEEEFRRRIEVSLWWMIVCCVAAGFALGYVAASIVGWV
jgi:hypothetical protein